MPDRYSTGVSPMGSLFSGMAHGLSESSKQFQEEAQAEERSRRKQALDLFGSMLDSATPETQPILLQQMAQMAGLKGKHRSLWDRFTDQGLNNNTNAIQERLQQVMGQVVPQSQYENLRGQQITNAIDQAFGARQDQPKLLEGKIALRDPQAEKLKYLEAQKKLDYQKALDLEQKRVESKRALAQETFNQKWKIASYAQEQKAVMELHRRAYVKAASHRGYGAMPTDAETIEVAKELEKETGLKADKLLAQIKLAGAKATEAQANANSLTPMTNTTTGTTEYLTPSQYTTRVEADRRAQEAAVGHYKTWASAKAEADQLTSRMLSLRQQLKGLAKRSQTTYDETNNKFSGAVNILLQKEVASALQEMSKVKAELQKYTTQMQTSASTLQSQYGTYYQVGKTPWNVTPKGTFGGVAPLGMPRATQGHPVFDATTPQPRPASPVPNDGTITSKSPRRHEVGTRITLGKGLYEVIEVGPVDTGNGMTTYKLKPVSKAGTRREAPRRANMGRGELP